MMAVLLWLPLQQGLCQQCITPPSKNSMQSSSMAPPPPPPPPPSSKAMLLTQNNPTMMIAVASSPGEIVNHEEEAKEESGEGEERTGGDSNGNNHDPYSSQQQQHHHQQQQRQMIQFSNDQTDDPYLYRFSSRPISPHPLHQYYDGRNHDDPKARSSQTLQLNNPFTDGRRRPKLYNNARGRRNTRNIVEKTPRHLVFNRNDKDENNKKRQIRQKQIELENMWFDEYKEELKREEQHQEEVSDHGPEWIPDPDDPAVYNWNPNIPTGKEERTVQDMQEGEVIRIQGPDGKPMIAAGKYEVYARPLKDRMEATRSTPRVNGVPVSLHIDPTELMPRRFSSAEEDKMHGKFVQKRQGALLMSAYESLKEQKLLDKQRYDALIYSFSHIKGWRMAHHLYREMTAVSLRRDATSLRHLLYGLGKSHRWQKALFEFDLARQSGVAYDNHIIRTMLDGCSQDCAYDATIRLLKLYKTHGNTEKDKRRRRIRELKREQEEERTSSDFRKDSWLVEDVVFGRKFIDSERTLFSKKPITEMKTASMAQKLEIMNADPNYKIEDEGLSSVSSQFFSCEDDVDYHHNLEAPDDHLDKDMKVEKRNMLFNDPEYSCRFFQKKIREYTKKKRGEKTSQTKSQQLSRNQVPPAEPKSASANENDSDEYYCSDDSTWSNQKLIWTSTHEVSDDNEKPLFGYKYVTPWR